MAETATAEHFDPETRRKIEEALRELDDPKSPARQLVEDSLRKWSAEVQPMIDAVSESERLSEDDMAIRVNTRE